MTYPFCAGEIGIQPSTVDLQGKRVGTYGRQIVVNGLAGTMCGRDDGCFKGIRQSNGKHVNSCLDGLQIDGFHL
jgi:hypothetical protein